MSEERVKKEIIISGFGGQGVLVDGQDSGLFGTDGG